VKVLVAAPLLYHPACGNGGGVICYRLLEGLAQRHELVFVGFTRADEAEQAAARTALERCCVAVEVVPLSARGPLSNLLPRLRQWAGGPPVEAQAFDRPEMHAALHAAVRRHAPDVALLQFPHMAQYAASVGTVPVLMDVQDVFFVSRLRDYAARTSTWPRLKSLVVWLAWTRYEMAWYRRCRSLMVLTEQDRAALGVLVPGVEAFTNPPAIAQRPVHAVQASARNVVGFAGSFEHGPNRDGLLWLGTEIAPLLAAQCPGVRIVVAGRGVPEALQAKLHPSVQCLGFVADYDAFVRGCSVFLAPLRSGGGIKTKVLDALACARPVVTTAIGAEGIPLDVDHGLTIAHDAAQLVQQVARHLTDPAPAQAAAARGAIWVARHFGVEGKVLRIEQETANWSNNESMSAVVAG
jgi:glycosyltransferase involved in cell wall biosynthesis